MAAQTHTKFAKRFRQEPNLSSILVHNGCHAIDILVLEAWPSSKLDFFIPGTMDLENHLEKLPCFTLASLASASPAYWFEDVYTSSAGKKDSLARRWFHAVRCRTSGRFGRPTSKYLEVESTAGSLGMDWHEVCFMDISIRPFLGAPLFFAFSRLPKGIIFVCSIKLFIGWYWKSASLQELCNPQNK